MLKKTPRFVIARGKYSLLFILKRVEEGVVDRNKVIFNTKKEAERAFRARVKPADIDIYRIFKI